MIELLAPVGSREALIAAVESGADAVYLAGKLFGARAYAANFTNQELKEAIEFAHKRNVLVDVAVNTVVDNAEFAELAEYLKFLYTAGADAIIVQDMGVAKLAREIAPGLALHASTQMTVHNLDGALKMQELGFERVVLSRELSMDDIKYICANVDVEIETFIHGALCICYSGQCLMSGMIGGRSGNRGRCAQPCRLPYTLIDESGTDMLAGADAGSYLLSPKDMNTCEMIGEFIDAGVTSFKIEGRMKRAEYVAIVVDTYRRSIDQYISSRENRVSDEDKKNLAQIFNRDFTTAYLKKRPGRLMMSDRRPNNRGVLAGRVTSFDGNNRLVTVKLSETIHTGDIVEFWVKVGGRVNATLDKIIVNGSSVAKAEAGQEASFHIDGRVHGNDRVFKVFDAQLMEQARAFFNTGAAIRRIPVDISVDASVGQPLRITVTDDDGHVGIGQTEFIGQKALKRPLDEASVRKQVARIGTTVYELRQLHCNIDGEVMIPVSEMNEARRQAMDMLDTARLAKFSRSDLPEEPGLWKRRLRERRRISPENVKIGVTADTLAKVQAAIENGADIIYFGGDSFAHEPITVDDYHKTCEMANVNQKQIYFSLPRIIRQIHHGSVSELVKSWHDCKIAGIAVNNIGAARLAQEYLDVPLHADMYLNLYNNLAIDYWREIGAQSFTLSPELNFGQIEKISSLCTDELECMVHGNLTLMVSEYCVLGSFLGGLDKGSCRQVCRQKQYYLLDRKSERFPIITDQYCHMHILNGKELSMYPHIQRLKDAGIKRLRIEGRYMTAQQLGQTVRLYKELAAFGNNHPLMDGDNMAEIECNNITRGHYFRGVL